MKVRKNYVARWNGKRGGQKEKLFFTLEAAQKCAAEKLQSGFKKARAVKRTPQKVAVVH